MKKICVMLFLAIVNLVPYVAQAGRPSDDDCRDRKFEALAAQSQAAASNVEDESGIPEKADDSTLKVQPENYIYNPYNRSCGTGHIWDGHQCLKLGEGYSFDGQNVMVISSSLPKGAYQCQATFHYGTDPEGKSFPLYACYIKIETLRSAGVNYGYFNGYAWIFAGFQDWQSSVQTDNNFKVIYQQQLLVQPSFGYGYPTLQNGYRAF